MSMGTDFRLTEEHKKVSMQIIQHLTGHVVSVALSEDERNAVADSWFA